MNTLEPCLVSRSLRVSMFAPCLVEKRKEAHGDSLDKQHKKKIEREEEKLKNNNRDLSFVKMKSMFAIGFAFTALLSMFNSMYVHPTSLLVYLDRSIMGLHRGNQ
uniref:Uncharacterized protein n=1 Tax=Timema cristinae TaxID=61476 RepID=A0A7R9D3Z7_TIMCR|nr:unnamed protein product [Timema cristinae]